MRARIPATLLTMLAPIAIGLSLFSASAPLADAEPSRSDLIDDAPAETWTDPAPDQLFAMATMIARVRIDGIERDGDGSVVTAEVERVFKGDVAAGDTIAIANPARWAGDGSFQDPATGTIWYAMLFATSDPPGAYAPPSATIGLYRVDVETPADPDEDPRDVVWASLRDSWPLAPFRVDDFEQWLRLGVGQFSGVTATDDEIRAVVDRLGASPLVPLKDEVRVLTDQYYCLEMLALAGNGDHVRLAARFSLSRRSHVAISAARALGWLGRLARGDAREVAMTSLVRLARDPNARVAAEALLGLERCALAWVHPATARTLIGALEDFSRAPVLVHERWDPETQPACPAVNELEPPRQLAYRAIEGLLGSEDAPITDAERADRAAGIAALHERLGVVSVDEAIWMLPPLVRLDHAGTLDVVARRLAGADGWPWSPELADVLAMATGEAFESASEFLDWIEQN